MTPSLPREQIDRLAGLDLRRKPRPRKRVITERVMTIVLAANFINPRAGVCAATIRLALQELGLSEGDQGNQYVGDVLGGHGLNLPTRKEGGITIYELPPGGISSDDLEAAFLIPPGWDWSRYELTDDPADTSPDDPGNQTRLTGSGEQRPVPPAASPTSGDPEGEGERLPRPEPAPEPELSPEDYPALNPGLLDEEPDREDD
jgi:hypothetical protein